MNTNNERAFYRAVHYKGASRRSFLKYYSFAVISLGLRAGMTLRIAWALENKPRVPIVWVHELEYTYYIESFIHSFHPLTRGVVLSLISLGYDGMLTVVTGAQTGEVSEGILNRYYGRYILVVEGNPPLGRQGIFCISSGRPFIEELKGAAAGASVIVIWGTCTSRGCAQAIRPNPTQAALIDKMVTDKPIVKVPGYPPIPDVMSAIITYLATLGRLPELDHLGRPLMFCGQRVHDRYYHHTYFDAGEFAESWDDDVTHQGYCLYEVGCKGPTAYSACSVIRWNDGASFPIQSDHDCLRYSENGFWDRGSFYSHVADIP